MPPVAGEHIVAARSAHQDLDPVGASYLGDGFDINGCRIGLTLFQIIDQPLEVRTINTANYYWLEWNAERSSKIAGVGKVILKSFVRQAWPVVVHTICLGRPVASRHHGSNDRA